MKIYHTETQADYDALMIELEVEGYKWRGTANKPTQWNGWKLTGKETGVRLDGDLIAQGSIAEYKSSYEQTPITTYKAKADNKMKFTKENVYRLFGDYRRIKNGIHRLDDLESAVMDLDDTPKKAVVPEYVAEWIEWNKQMGVRLKNLLKCYADFCRGEEPNVSSEWLKAVHWYVDNPYKFIQAYENGYTIEPEQLYYIPLPDLETSDGIQQVLSKRKNDTHYFASRPNNKLKQRYTKEELEQVPEIYKPFAKPVEEEEE